MKSLREGLKRMGEAADKVNVLKREEIRMKGGGGQQEKGSYQRYASLHCQHDPHGVSARAQPAGQLC